MRLELVFAGLEILTCLKDEHAADEHPGLVDDALARQHIGDVAHAGSVRDIDDAVLRQRARLLEALLADEKHDARHDRQQHENTDDGVADDDERMPSARRAAGRHFDRVRLDCRSRATRHEPLRIVAIRIHRRHANSIRRPLRNGRIRISSARRRSCRLTRVWHGCKAWCGLRREFSRRCGADNWR